MEKKQHGGIREGQGRKSKAEEQKLIEHLTPMNSMALKALEKGLKDNDSWAIKLYFEYFYGKPKQQLDVTTDGESFNIPTINFTRH